MLFELTESKHKPTAITLLNVWDNITMTITCTYFMLISRDWFYLYLIMTIAGSLSYILSMFLLPESPKWLMYEGREEDAIDSLNYIAKINGSKFRFPKDKSITFLECIIASKQKADANQTLIKDETNAKISDDNDSFVSGATNPSYW